MSEPRKPENEFEPPGAHGPDERTDALLDYLKKITLIPGMVAAMKVAGVASPPAVFGALFVADYLLREAAEMQAMRTAAGDSSKITIGDVVSYVATKPATEMAEAFGNIAAGAQRLDWDKNDDGKVSIGEMVAASMDMIGVVKDAFSVTSAEQKDLWKDVAESALMASIGYVTVGAVGETASVLTEGAIAPNGILTGLAGGTVFSAVAVAKEQRGIYILDLLSDLFKGDGGDDNGSNGPQNGAGPRSRPGGAFGPVSSRAAAMARAGMDKPKAAAAAPAVAAPVAALALAKSKGPGGFGFPA